VAVPLAACPTAGGDKVEHQTLSFMGRPVTGIAPDNTLETQDGLVVVGDARLVEAVRSGHPLTVRTLERFPPVFVVTYPDGTEMRYQSRRAKP
jgi:hypothetical protein